MFSYAFMNSGCYGESIIKTEVQSIYSPPYNPAVASQLKQKTRNYRQNQCEKSGSEVSKNHMSFIKTKSFSATLYI